MILFSYLCERNVKFLLTYIYIYAYNQNMHKNAENKGGKIL